MKLLFLQANNLSTSLLLPSIAPVATFAAHIAMGKNLTVSDVSERLVYYAQIHINSLYLAFPIAMA